MHLRVRRYLPQDDGAEGSELSAGLTTERWTEDPSVQRAPVHVNVDSYAGLLGRTSTAQVYEYVAANDADKTDLAEQAGWGCMRLVINAQNCIYCKFCDVKGRRRTLRGRCPRAAVGRSTVSRV